MKANRASRVCVWGGFTLIELLVVIAIIAILLPALTKAKERSSRTKRALVRVSRRGKTVSTSLAMPDSDH